MELTIHDVGLCGGCPALRTGCPPARFSVTFTKIGKCFGCRWVLTDACSKCERDETLLQRRDFHGRNEAVCYGCQRDLELLKRQDLYERGKSEKVVQDMKEVDKEVGTGEDAQLRALKTWARGG